MEKKYGWNSIKGYEGLYWVNRKGQIKNSSGRILKPFDNGTGYSRVTLMKEGVKSNVLVHRIVAETFIDNPENKPEVNHKNKHRYNNWACNLEWCTRSENELHKHRGECI